MKTQSNQPILHMRFLRWTGVAALTAGTIYLLIQLLHPADTLASVTTPMWVAVHILSIVMDFLVVIGLTGIYARASHKVGVFGFIGYLLFSLFFALSLAFHFIEAFVFPALASSTPQFVEGLQGLVTGSASEVSLGATPAVYAIAGVSYLLGGFLLGISLLRTRSFPRWACLLLAFGSLVIVLGAIIPHPFDRIMAVPVGVALIWLGVSNIKYHLK